jgi:hypothetical protein
MTTRTLIRSIASAVCLWACSGQRAAAQAEASVTPSETQMKTAVEAYFGDLFQRLGKAAAQSPTEENFRAIMNPQIDQVDGLFGATLIDADWEIRQVYFRRDFLAVGFSLKKVKELDTFRVLMEQRPEPQLSEPGHGNIMQPRLIAMRYPVVKDGKMACMVSMMVRTESFLKTVGLDKCTAFKIICLGKDAESRGTLSEKRKEIKIQLPSTEWVIQYE